MRSTVLLFAMRAINGAALGSAARAQDRPDSTLSEEAAAYLARALDTMQQQSINPREIDWQALRARVLQVCRTGQPKSALRSSYVRSGGPDARFRIPRLGSVRCWT